MDLNRRRFLQVAAVGVIAGIASARYRRLTSHDGPVDRPELLLMLGPDRVRELGTHYRSVTPAENNADALREALADGQARPFFGRKPIADMVRDDFADGRTVVVDGWVLSVTEARQAALFSVRTSPL
jgi:hypothetical protein